MCGLTTGGRCGNRQVFELTSTWGACWHRFCARNGCLGSAPSAIAEAHLEPADFTVVHDSGSSIALDEPGAAHGSTDELYAAVNGRA